MKIISIDPSGNGVTAIVVVNYDYSAEEPVNVTNFAQVDFRADGETNSEFIKEKRYLQTEAVIEFVLKEKPIGVIIENFIMFSKQIGKHGMSFVTSELIGALELAFRRAKIPVVKPRSSDLKVMNGYGQSTVKHGLSTNDLYSRGILVHGKRNRTCLMVNGKPYDLIDYKIGSKNDHLYMAIKHFINEVEYKTPNLFDRIERIKELRYESKEEE